MRKFFKSVDVSANNILIKVRSKIKNHDERFLLNIKLYTKKTLIKLYYTSLFYQIIYFQNKHRFTFNKHFKLNITESIESKGKL